MSFKPLGPKKREFFWSETTPGQTRLMMDFLREGQERILTKLWGKLGYSGGIYELLHSRSGQLDMKELKTLNSSELAYWRKLNNASPS